MSETQSWAGWERHRPHPSTCFSSYNALAPPPLAHRHHNPPVQSKVSTPHSPCGCRSSVRRPRCATRRSSLRRRTSSCKTGYAAHQRRASGTLATAARGYSRQSPAGYPPQTSLISCHALPHASPCCASRSPTGDEAQHFLDST